MASARARPKSSPLKVELPRPDQEKLPFGRVGIIAIIGFGIGILWPRLAGVRLVPSAPTPEEPASAEQAGSGAPAASSSPPPPVKPLPVEPALPKAEPALHLNLSEPQVTSCRSRTGKRSRDCDKIAVDAALRSRLMLLAECPEATHAHGMLSLGLELDFGSLKVREVIKGKSTTLNAEQADALVGCAKTNLANAPLEGITHAQTSYTVFYRLDFARAGTAAGEEGKSGAPEESAASGRATVLWEVAVVHASATKDSDVVARVLRGTRLVVTAKKADWYKIKYDAKGSEGWVFHTALGL